MQLKITKDDLYGPGCAWLEISAAVPADVTFRLTCLDNTLKPHLGQQGWQSAPYEIQPRSIVPTRTGTRMLVGPEVVDRLEADMRVTLEIPATGYTAHAIWPDIPVSGVRYQAKLDGPSGPQTLPPLPSRIGGVENSNQKTPPFIGADEQDHRDRAEGLHPGDHRTIWHRLRFPTSRTSILSLASLAFLISAAFGYTLVDWRKSIAPDTAATALGAEAGEAARLLLARSPELDRLFGVGVLLHQTPGAARDLGLQAIERAAEYDHTPSILWLGRIFDPGENGLAGAVREPNIAEAARAYSRAARLGDNRARELLGAVCSELRRKAVSEAEVQARDRLC